MSGLFSYFQKDLPRNVKSIEFGETWKVPKMFKNVLESVPKPQFAILSQ